MFSAVCSVVVALEVLSFGIGGVTADSTEDSRIYGHSNDMLQNKRKDELIIMQVGKNATPYFKPPQYTCLRNGSLLCPAWSYCDSTSGTCVCPEIPTHALNCDGFDKESALRILDCNCVTYDEERDLTEVGLCIYNCIHFKAAMPTNIIYTSLPSNTSDWNDIMCGKFNRTGTLCGRCNTQDGFYPQAYSFDVTCTQCTNGKPDWWKYVLSAYLPLTLFYFIILCFKININSSQLQGYIIYSQIITMPPFARCVYTLTQNTYIFPVVRFLGSMYGIWNLDFFRMYNTGICLQTDTLATLALDLVVAVYPLLLMTVTYMMISLYDSNSKLFVILWSPFRAFFNLFHKKWDIRTSTVDAFCTFLFLTNMKFLSVCFDLLIPVRVFHFVTPQRQVNYTWQLFYDATLPYFRGAHLRYGILASALLFLFVLTPTLIIIAYPIKVCHKCFNTLPRRGQLLLHTFMDSFQGCYKDGTEPGTRDCRWFSSVLFILRFGLFSIYAYTQNAMYFSYAAMALVITAMITIAADPFKTHLSHLSSIIAVFILFVAALYVCVVGLTMAGLKSAFVIIYVFNSLNAIMAALPLVYISVLILHWIFHQKKFGLDFISRVNAWRQGYKKLNDE